MMWYNILLFDVIQKSIFSPLFSTDSIFDHPLVFDLEKRKKINFQRKKR